MAAAGRERRVGRRSRPRGVDVGDPSEGEVLQFFEEILLGMGGGRNHLLEPKLDL